MLDASYYDGHSARRHPATLEISDGMVVVRWLDQERREPCASVEVSESLAAAPRTLTFRDGALCDVADDAPLQAMLAAAGYTPDRVDRWQRSWSIAAGSVALLILIAVVGYLYGLPALADHVAGKVPDSVTQHLSTRTIDTLDALFLDPTSLPEKRQASLAAGFERLRRPDDSPSVKLHFRSSERLGPNALALPDGQIVLLDELIRLADNDEQIYAVIGHELGHGHYRHGLKATLEATIIGTVMFAWLGDINWLLATVPTAVLQARYSRAFEIEADLFGARMMKANGIKPSRLAEMLEKLQGWKAAEKPKSGEEDEEGGIGSFLSSHPSTPARIEALRRMDSAD